MDVTDILKLLQKEKFKILIIISFLASIASLLLTTLSIQKSPDSTQQILDTSSKMSEELASTQNALSEQEVFNGSVSEEILNLKKQNTLMLDQAESCKKFSYFYFVFYEKATEMFANGASGCAVKYIQSGKPKEMSDGCFMWDSRKVKVTNFQGSKPNYKQDPDQKYYDSLKNAYNMALQYQSACVNPILR